MVNNPAQDFIDNLFEYVANDAITTMLARDVEYINDDDIDDGELAELMSIRS